MNPLAPALPAFVAIGEALTDLVVEDVARQRWRALPGGSTWNVARAMAALGVPSAFAGAISADIFGDALWAASTASGLDLRFLQRLPKAPLLAVVHQTQPPAYFFIGDDSADLHFDPARLPTGWQANVQWAHFGGISLAREPLASRLIELAAGLKASGVRISYDPNFRVLMDESYDATLRRMTALADVVKVSDEDLTGLFRTGDDPGAIADALSTMRNLNPAAIVLCTHGADGATLHMGQQNWHAAPPSIEVEDTVGAGDASMAALLYSLTQHPHHAPAQHLRFAVAGGAAACMAAGATPPSLSTIQRLMLR